MKTQTRTFDILIVVTLAVGVIVGPVSAAHGQIKDKFRVAEVQLIGVVLPGYCMPQPACVIRLDVLNTLQGRQKITKHRLFLQSPIDNNTAFNWCISRSPGECIVTGNTNQIPGYYNVSFSNQLVEALIINEYRALGVSDCSERL